MSSKRPNLVLLTATVVVPAGARNLARRDATQRLQDDQQAFDFYRSQLARGSFDMLVLCEHSGYELAPLHARVPAAGLHDRVELMGHKGLAFPSRYGRGYGEFKLVDRAMQHSVLINRPAPDLNIWKLTGRYRVHNFDKLVASQPEHADLSGHCRTLPRPWLDMYIMRRNRRAHAELIRGLYRRLQPGCDPGQRGAALSRHRRAVGAQLAHRAPLQACAAHRRRARLRRPGLWHDAAQISDAGRGTSGDALALALTCATTPARRGGRQEAAQSARLSQQPRSTCPCARHAVRRPTTMAAPCGARMNPRR